MRAMLLSPLLLLLPAERASLEGLMAQPKGHPPPQPRSAQKEEGTPTGGQQRGEADGVVVVEERADQQQRLRRLDGLRGVRRAHLIACITLIQGDLLGTIQQITKAAVVQEVLFITLHVSQTWDY